MLIYVYAVVGSFLFADTDPEHFGNLGLAMRTMVQVVTFDDWAAIMNAQPDPLVATLYFIPFILIGTMVVLNLFIGVIIEGFDHARRRVVIEPVPEEPTTDGRQPTIEADLARISDELDSLKRDVDRLVVAAQQELRR
jgi:voltage-gated sodium channel